MAAQPDPLGDKKLKDLLLDWQGKIKDHRESFIRSADKISQWDAGLRSATVDLRQLELEVESLEQESKSVQASLQSMESSQNSLESRLKVEEEKFRQRVDLNPDSGAYVARAQMARRDAYNAAMELQALLDGLEQALNKVDEMVTTAAEASLNNPLSQVRLLLYQELRNLSHMMNASQQLNGQVNDVVASLGQGGGGVGGGGGGGGGGGVGGYFR